MHTGDGKSSFIRQCAQGAARSGVGVLWFVCEDPEDATAERDLASETGITTEEIGRLDLDKAQLQRLDDAAKKAEGWASRILPIFEHVDVDEALQYVDDTTTIGGAPLGEVWIDYAQLLAPSRSLEEEMARLGVEMHSRSRDRRFATGIASQVASDVIKRGREAYVQKKDISQIRPSLGDTEWCRRLEKLCKAVWAGVRPGRWLREWGEDVADDYAELHVVKSNFGRLGWAELGWDGSTCRFLNKD